MHLVKWKYRWRNKWNNLGEVLWICICIAEQNMYCRTEYFANSFFPYTIKEWNNLSPEIRKSVSYEVFKNSLLKFIRPSPNSLFNVSDSLGIKLLTRLRLGLSHLREYKFNHNFQDTIAAMFHLPLCSCSLGSESTTNFFLRCQNFTDLRKCLMHELIKIDSCILTLDEKSFTKLLLYGDGRYDSKTNKSIILASINFIYSSKRFDGQLMWQLILALFRFQCLPHYNNEPDNVVSS